MNLSGIMAATRIDSARKLAAVYVLIGSLWIIGSDWWVGWSMGQTWAEWRLDCAKDLLFIVTTAVLLYLLTESVIKRHVAVTVALHDSEERLALALAAANQGLYDVDLQTGRAVVNDTYATMLGYEPAGFVESWETWRARLHPRDRVATEQALADYLAGRTKQYHAEFRVKTADGSWRWIQSQGRIVARDAAGQPRRMIGTYLDINDRKNSEARTADALAFAQTVLRHSPLGIVAYGPDGRAAMANESAAKIVGMNVDAMLLQNYRELESWRRHGLLAAAVRALASGSEVIHEGLIETTAGRAVWLEARFVPFRYADAQHLLLMMTDKTEQRRTLENLHLMDTAVRAAPGGWVMTDAAGCIQWVNPGFTALTGYAAEEVTGRSLRVLRSGEQSTAFYGRMWQTIKRGEVWSGEIINRRKDGTNYHEYMTIAPVRGPDGTITQFVAMKQDITEQKSLEQQVARAQRLESIGLLASGIAHDLNNILAPISLALELLRFKFPGAEGAHLVELIETAAKRGAGVVRQVLTFARGIDGARVEVQPKHLLKDLAQMAEETFPRDIAIKLEIAPDVQPVLGDITQLHQVLLNLAVNARDAMPHGGQLRFGATNVMLVEESIRGAGLLPAGPYVALTVTDTGTGIPPEVVDRMFEPFYTTKPQGKGTGLGLSTVYGIVRRHGGIVEVNTKLGQGTEFCVLLPAAKEAAPGPATGEPENCVLKGEGRRILVVDDEEIIRQVTAGVLERHGFVAETAVDGVEGLQLFRRRGDFAAVITDLMMPRMNGYQLAGEIRRENSQVPIIASSGMTGDATVSPETGLAQCGVRTLLMKPYTEDALLAALTAELADRPGELKQPAKMALQS